MPRRALWVMLALLVLSLLFGPAAPVVNAAPTTDSADALARLFALAQKHHVAAGCAPWRHDPRLDRAAQLHAEELARNQRISHRGLDGSTVRTRALRQGYQANRATESIALYRTPEKAVTFWMNEGPKGPHRRNITWCQYTDAGVGVAYDKRGTPYWVMDYVNGE